MGAVENLRREIAALTETRLSEELFRGSVVRVERSGKPILEEAWGYALFTGSEKTPLSVSSVFDVASVSKLFTSTAVLRLVTTGKLRLEDPIADVLEYGAVRAGGLLAGVTVESLLTHSSGIHYWYPFYARRKDPFEEVLADVLSEHPPAGQTIYSDINFMLLGKAVSAVTGLDLPRAMRELVFEPLRLSSTGYEPRGDDVVATEFGNRIEMGMVREINLAFDGWRDTSRPFRGECDDGNCFYYFGGAAGHAGVFSDARDVCALGSLYLPSGNGHGFLDPDLARKAVLDHGGGRGLGFQLGENYPQGCAGHTGFTGTYLYVNPGLDLAVTVLTNRLHVPQPRKATDYMRDVSVAVVNAIGSGGRD